ncbi:MAG: pyridoxal-phosphate dependent enzyme [Saprospiraceae bacterium]|uniref:Pyridoxal-phosphate dependent enzyme n=1 Tax=Candidatus Opimibacter skivensis TaxID=2982028 RepID=A0A9D7T0L6_9BACT|nr:pyridoxal-phosphate dependent enzyme [Candidatus Opimibacter skivensis]
MKFANNVLETIGNTPMIRLNKVVKGVKALVLAKVETFNPGHSIKDRMALQMIDDAEAAGKLVAGGTIIECTSGNTGMGIALVAAVRGYKCIFTTSDKQSKEKIDMLKALGAEVIVCPTNVEPTDPRSYYSVAERLSQQIPNSYWCNQYDNLSNSKAHYLSTGPEIWEQTDGKITHLVVGVGTGGTVSGVSKYLKERNPNIKVWGIDTYGSVFKKYKETGIFDEKEIYPYITEGIGEDILPKNVDFSLIDHFEKVSDADGALAARRLAREEGLLMGYSAGSALAGLLQMKDLLKPEDVVVVIFHDHGSRYVGKIYNDDWMRERGFLDKELMVKDILKANLNHELITVNADDKVRQALKLMKEYDISQMPVMSGEEIVGSVSENTILTFILENPLNHAEKPVSDIMDEPFPMVSEDLAISKLNKYITKKIPAVMAKDKAGNVHILTKYDILQMI